MLKGKNEHSQFGGKNVNKWFNINAASFKWDQQSLLMPSFIKKSGRIWAMHFEMFFVGLLASCYVFSIW